MEIEVKDIGIRLCLSPIGDGELPFNKEEVELSLNAVISALRVMYLQKSHTLIDTSKYLSEASSNLSKDLIFTRNVPDLDKEVTEDTRDRKGDLDTLSRGPKIERMTPSDIVSIYNDMAKQLRWQKCVVIGEDLQKKLLSFAKKHPERSYWETVMRGWASNPFYSGRSGIYTRVKIRTMVVSSRYHEFYEDGLELDDPTPPPVTQDEKLVADLDAMLAAIP